MNALDFTKGYNKITKKVAEDSKGRDYNQNFKTEITDDKKINLIIKTDKQ